MPADLGARAVAGLLLLLVLGVPVPASAATSADAAFRLQDPRIDEASGIAVGVRSPGVVYVHNDSGDTARVFAVDARSGATVAVVTITGAVNHDWEDLAAAPDSSGTPSLWIADTGDNAARRDQVQVYRVPEPGLDAAARGASVSTAPADVWRVRYPTGPVDVESLAVAPDGTPYLVTKSPLGHSVAYRLPRQPDAARVRTAERVGTIDFSATGTANPFGVLGTLAATGAVLSPDGRQLVVRTYADAWIWQVGRDGVAAALRGTPRRVPLPAQRQGEGVALAGNHLLVDSEGRGATVWAVPVRSPRPAAASPPTSSATSSSPSSSPGRSDPLPSRRAWGLAVGAAIVVAGAAAWLVRRRDRG